MNINMDSITRALQSFADGLSGKASLSRLFPDDFVQNWSDFRSISELLSPVGFTDQSSFDEWYESDASDEYIRKNTGFDSMDEMVNRAGKIFALGKKLQLGDGTWKEETFDTGDIFKDIGLSPQMG